MHARPPGARVGSERDAHKALGRHVQHATMRAALSTRPRRTSSGKQFACACGGVRRCAAARTAVDRPGRPGRGVWLSVDLGTDGEFGNPAAGIWTAVEACRHSARCCYALAADTLARSTRLSDMFFRRAFRLGLGALLGTSAALEGWHRSWHDMESRASCSNGLASVKPCWPGGIELHTRISR